MRYRASWMALPNESGRLRDVGVLVAGGDEIGFAAFEAFPNLQQTFQNQLTSVSGKLTPDEILDYYIERANGQTVEFSAAFEVEAPNLDAALAAALQGRA